MVVQSFGKLGIASILSLLLGFQFGDHASDPEVKRKVFIEQHNQCAIGTITGG